MLLIMHYRIGESLQKLGTTFTPGSGLQGYSSSVRHGLKTYTFSYLKSTEGGVSGKSPAWRFSFDVSSRLWRNLILSLSTAIVGSRGRQPGSFRSQSRRHVTCNRSLIRVYSSEAMSTATKPKLPPVAMDTITQQIGNTPIVKLNRIPQSLGIEATVYAKLEFFNAGGSVKDRIALRMIEQAERSGRIKPGDTLIEPTSGNTSVGLKKR